MANRRIFELAKELGVTSKAILTKCRAEGLADVVKTHMSPVKAGLEATIREWFGEESTGGTAVEVAEHVDVKKERARAVRQSRRSKAEAAVAEAPPVEAPAAATAVAEEAVPPAEGVVEAPAPTAVAEMPVETASQAAVAAEAPPAVAAAAEAPPETPVAAAASPVAAAVAEAPPAPTPPPVVEEAAPAAPGVREAPAPPKRAAPPPEEPAKAEPPRPPVRPAGPQLVPRPAVLRGPRVVRVEQPDFVGPRPPRRRPAPAAQGPVPAAPVPAGGPSRRGKQPAASGAPTAVDDEAGAKKGKRRSPRRKGGGRSADSGERLKEWRETDLVERSARLAAAAGGGLRRHRASIGRRSLAAQAILRTGQIEIDEPITVKGLSAATGLKAADIIRRLMELGIRAKTNQVLDLGMAQTALADYDVELVVRRVKAAEELLLERLASRPKGELVTRAPVVTFLGHVDHGKTSLLDRIRNTAIAASEAGGITQHIGAYRYDIGKRHVVFLDTPGHEAFTAMRARGANMTDVVVLVVAADDGVMPQTVEALSHAKAAEVPIVVALNKIDLPGANVQRALGQLAEHGLQPREWGGTVEVIRTSAATGEGIDDLVETLSLEAELLELNAEIEAPASGFVIESAVDPGRGALARLLVRNGTLRVGDILLAGRGQGRVRQIVDDRGKVTDSAGPSTPVEVAGLGEVPEAGDRFYVLSDLDEARTVAEDRWCQARSQQLAVGPTASLEGLLARMQAGETNQVPLIVKADMQGSVEALVASLNKLGTAETKVNVLHAAAGGISTGDVTLADASGALIVGYNTVPDAAARQLAEQLGVEIRLYRIIYEILQDVRKILEEGLAPEVRQETLGRAEVRKVFKVSRVGTVAGCYVTDGLVARNARVRIIRNSIVVEDERSLESLKRFKDDAREVRAGLECGVKVAGYDDIKEGDVLEFYHKVEVARKL